MIPLSAEEAGRALGLEPLAFPVVGVAIDSRSLKSGDLFVALRGERFDGHDFVEAAFAAGAAGAVVEKRAWGDRTIEAERPLYRVDDTLQALGALARAVRRKSSALVFAITGSVGKTGTKDVLAAMAGRVRRTVATAANQNNEVGVPLTLLAIKPETEVVIVEMGMRGRGQIRTLARVAEPDIGVITSVHPVHLELLGSLQAVAEAKAELIEGVKSGGAMVVPADCAVLGPYLLGCGCKVVRFSARPQMDAAEGAADVEAWFERRREAAGCAVALRWPGGEAEVETFDLPAYRLENIVAAAAACYAAGLPVDGCVEAIADVRFGGGRGEVLRFPGIVLVDDTYNANPAAVRAALEDLVRLAAENDWRPVAVLGDMLELGPRSEAYHREVGEYAADLGVQALWGVGPRAAVIVDGFRARAEGAPGRARRRTAGHVGSSEESSSVEVGLRPGDVVLFKASRGVKLEGMVDRVAALAEAGRWAPSGSSGGEGADEPEEMKPC